MERLETEWTEYPVLHMDFSGSKYTDVESLKATLDIQISHWEELYGSFEKERTFSNRFEGVIQRAYQRTGKQVVVLIDEYDAPLLDTNSELALQKELRNIVRDFFSSLKKNGQYLRFLLLTGISKFSQLSIFSEQNNLQNISMRDEYSALCGITERELLACLQLDIQRMAEANGETYEEACAHLKMQSMAIILVRIVRIFTIRSVCLMLLMQKNIRTTGSLPVHPLFYWNCFVKPISTFVNWKVWKLRTNSLMRLPNRLKVLYLYFIRV